MYGEQARLTQDEAANPLDGLLPAVLRHALEDRYWRPIEAQCTLEAIVDDATFVSGPGTHVALFSDHGTVHVRDVAARAVELVAAADGLLLPARPPGRRRFVQGVAASLAYLHDIGMVDATPAGRRAHPQFAAQTPYTDAFADLLADIVRTDAGGVRSRLDAVEAAAPLGAPVAEVLREILATTMAHSKTAVPAGLLADPQGLRDLLRSAVWTPLPGRDRSPADDGRRDRRAAFAWLTSPHPAHRELADDVLDAVRAVRVADALRQRGTAFRTSGGYEVFLEPATGAAVACLRTRDEQRSFFLRFFSQISTGEANIRYADVTAGGALRIAFHRGAFPSQELTGELARNCAHVVLDVIADVLPTFAERVPALGLVPPRLAADAQRIELVTTDGVTSFARAVRDLVVLSRPSLASSVDVLDHDPEPPADDLDWAQAGDAVDPHSAVAAELLRRLALHGLDGQELAGSRLVRVPAETTVMHAGSRGEWVLVPTGPGLEVRPLGGYRPLPLPAFAPLGVTGVVRGSERNATIVAGTDVEVLAIPGEVFVQHWFRPYDAAGLRDALRGAAVSG